MPHLLWPQVSPFDLTGFVEVEKTLLKPLLLTSSAQRWEFKCRKRLPTAEGRQGRTGAGLPAPPPHPPLLSPLTVVVQQQLGGREQLGPMLRVHDVQLIEVCFP